MTGNLGRCGGKGPAKFGRCGYQSGRGKYFGFCKSRGNGKNF